MSDEEIGSLVAISRSRTEPGSTRANAARLSRAPVLFAVGKRLGVIIKRSTNCGRRGCWRVTRGEHGPAAGNECLAHVAQGTVCKILGHEDIKPHKVRYYLERRRQVPAEWRRFCGLPPGSSPEESCRQVAEIGLSYDEKADPGRCDDES